MAANIRISGGPEPLAWRGGVTACYNRAFMVEFVLALLAALRVFFHSRGDAEPDGILADDSGRPTGLDFRRQNSRNPWRCQRMSVSGFTFTNASRQ